MNVGRRVDYAVRALSYLAGQPSDKIVSRADIEKSQDIPSFYLSKIMKDLVAGGLVQSHIGSKGGFTLAKAPHTISIKSVDGVLGEGRRLLLVLLGVLAKIDLGRSPGDARYVSGRGVDRRDCRPAGS